MKKILLVIGFIAVLSSCNLETSVRNAYGSEKTKQKIAPYTYKLTIEGHEYLMFEGLSVGYGTPISVVHSASCPCGWIKAQSIEN